MSIDDGTLQVEITIVQAKGRKGGWHRSPAVPKVPDPPRIPRIARLMALAVKIQDMVNRGMTLDQVKKANPTNGYRARYGTDSGPWTTDMVVEAIYKSLVAKK